MKITLNKKAINNEAREKVAMDRVPEGLNRFLLLGDSNYRIVKKPIRVVIKK